MQLTEPQPSTRIDLQVGGMSCGHCEAAVRAALLGVDPDACDIRIDRAAGQVSLASRAPATALIAALTAEGYAASLK